ncbi:hypothetical protein JVU11DRAFT_12822 [Chiua virens]|nr:hypothetical protein JVU11DRAFT_12822 [Chiua virens]
MSTVSFNSTSLPSAIGYSATLSRDPSDINSDGATAQDVVSSSDVSTVPLVQITALPPATTSSQAIVPKLPYRHEVNILYLVPLFVAAGVALGSITAVILLKLRKTRRRSLRTSTLLSGPPYIPPENDVEDHLLVHGLPSMESVSLFAAGTPSKITVHGSRYVPKRMLGWQPRSVTQPPHSQPTYTQTIIPSSDGEKFTVITQEDPFVAASPVIRDSSLPKDNSPPKIHIAPSLPEPTFGDNSKVSRSQDTGLPKPFRRSMFDIMKLKGPHRPVSSVRNEYAILTPVVGPVDSRSHKTRHSQDDGLYSSNTEDALDLFGFQGRPQNDPRPSPKQAPLLEQGTLTSPTQDRNTRQSRKVAPFASKQTGSPTVAMSYQDELMDSGGPDIYTAAPQRHRSGTRRKTSSVSGTSKRFSALDMHTSILPLSPPALMSPPLEKSLFFTTSLSSRASLAGFQDTLPATSPSPLHRVDRSPEFYLFPSPSKKSKSTKTLQTSRPEPLLPYPSYPYHAHVPPTPRQVSNATETKLRSESPGSPERKGRASSATYRESATGISSLGSLSPTTLAIALASSSSSDVLNKIHDIVAEGYMKRRASVDGGGSVAVPL